MIDLDFSDDRVSSKELIDELSRPVEEGEYLLIIADAEIKANKDEKKHPSLKVTLKLTEGEEKKTIWKWMYLDKSNQIGMAQVREFLEAVYNEELTGNVTLDPKDLVGRYVVGMVTQEPRNDDKDKMTNAVDVFLPAP